MINYKEELKKIKIVDAHMHLGVMANTFFYNYHDEKVIDIEKKFNVRKCICSHTIGFYDIDRQIKLIKEASSKFGNYIYWYLIYDPNNSDKSLKLIKQNMNNINFAGVKIHPQLHTCLLNDEKYFPLWDFAIDNDIIILSHTWSPYTDTPTQFYANPLLLEDVLPKFEGLKFISGHGGGKVPFYDKVVGLLKRHSSLFIEYSGDTLYPKIFRKAIDEIGSERILFGTDMPIVDIRYHIISILKAGLTQAERDNITYNNAIELFKLPV